MLTHSRQLPDEGEAGSSTVLQLEPDVLAERDRAAEERQSLLAAVTETLREWDRSLVQRLPEEEQVAALRSHQAARRKAEEAGCLDSDIQAASGDVVNLPFVAAAGDDRQAALLDEVETSWVSPPRTRGRPCSGTSHQLKQLRQEVGRTIRST
jgi:hypothetical protein